MMMERSVGRRSSSVNARPRTMGMPSVRKYAGRDRPPDNDPGRALVEWRLAFHHGSEDGLRAGHAAGRQRIGQRHGFDAG